MKFYKNLVERAVLTGIQSYLGIIGADQIVGLDVAKNEMAIADGI